MVSYICIAGNLGSGKTTLARNLSKLLGWPIVRGGSDVARYVEDQFRDPHRYTFEAQLAILAGKIARMNDCTRAGQPFIVDRSPFEDAAIFAQALIERDWLDERSARTYRSLAADLLAPLSTPTALVYIECSVETCKHRLLARPRSYQQLYPEAHLADLHRRYERWVTTLRCPVVTVNSETSDVGSSQVGHDILQEVRAALRVNRDIGQQLEFPGFSACSPAEQLQLFQPQAIPPGITRLPLGGELDGTGKDRLLSSVTPTRIPRIYVAAPFTNLTTGEPERSGEAALIEYPDAHGAIRSGEMRTLLEELSSALVEQGYEVLLPHRDINLWGRRKLSPEAVARGCIAGVEASDVFVGILDHSYGAHVEAGVAVALGKPTILVQTLDVQPTFMANALMSSGLTIRMTVDTLRDVVDQVRRGSFAKYINAAHAAVEAGRLVP